MKILFINGFSKDQISGESKVAEEISHYFAKDPNLEVALIRSGEFTGEGPDEDGLKIFNVKAYNDSFVSISKFTNMDIIKIRRFLKNFNPDIIHSHTIIPFVLVMQSWAISNKIPFIYTTHALPSELSSFVAQDSTKFLKTISFTIQNYAKIFYRNCDALIALNKPAKDSIESVGYKGPVYVIPNGRDLKRYNKGKTLSFKDTDINLTFVGYLDKRKNQKYLVHSLKYLPNRFHLHLIGTNDGKRYSKELEQLILDLHLEHRVHLYGTQPHEKVIDVLNNTHIFVSASTKEVQSLAILESLASGTPVVGLSNETVDQFIDKSTGVRLEKDAKPGDFAREIKKLSRTNDKDYHQISVNCVKAVEHFDWSNVQINTIDAYNEIIRNRKDRKLDIKLRKLLNTFNKLFSDGPQEEKEIKSRKNLPILLIIIAVAVPLYSIVYFTIKFINKRKKQK